MKNWFIKELQQNIIVDFEIITGEELAKKYLPETPAGWDGTFGDKANAVAESKLYC